MNSHAAIPKQNEETAGLIHSFTWTLRRIHFEYQHATTRNHFIPEAHLNPRTNVIN